MPRKRKRQRKNPLPKGTYRLPTGGYAAKPTVHVGKSGKALKITGVVRDKPDLRKIARAVIELAGKRLLGQQLADSDDEAAYPRLGRPGRRIVTPAFRSASLIVLCPVTPK